MACSKAASFAQVMDERSLRARVREQQVQQNLLGYGHLSKEKEASYLAALQEERVEAMKRQQGYGFLNKEMEQSYVYESAPPPHQVASPKQELPREEVPASRSPRSRAARKRKKEKKEKKEGKNVSDLQQSGAVVPQKRKKEKKDNKEGRNVSDPLQSDAVVPKKEPASASPAASTTTPIATLRSTSPT